MKILQKHGAGRLSKTQEDVDPKVMELAIFYAIPLLEKGSTRVYQHEALHTTKRQND